VTQVSYINREISKRNTKFKLGPHQIMNHLFKNKWYIRDAGFFCFKNLRCNELNQKHWALWKLQFSRPKSSICTIFISPICFKRPACDYRVTSGCKHQGWNSSSRSCLIIYHLLPLNILIKQFSWGWRIYIAIWNKNFYFNNIYISK
jgi:hypothetical protein